MDLSKAFGCLPYDLITAKLHAYGVDYDILRLNRNCRSNWHQRIKFDLIFSLWLQKIVGVPQGSILPQVTSLEHFFKWSITHKFKVNCLQLCWWQHTLLLWRNYRKLYRNLTIRSKSSVQVVWLQSNNG